MTDGVAGGAAGRTGRVDVAARRQRVLAQIAAAVPELSAARVAAAVDATAASGRALQVLDDALTGDPDALRLGAPPVVGRLVAALIAAGATLPVPSCVRCGRVDRPLTRSDEGGVCPRCRRWQTARPCAVCSAVRPVTARTTDGGPLCPGCAPRPERRCGVCGRVRVIARRGRDGHPDVCDGCFRMPEAVCHRCGQQRPCSWAATAAPVCIRCAQRRTRACAHCGEQRPPTVRWSEGPVCEPCYRTALARRGPCTGCGVIRRLVDPPGPAASRCAGCAAGPTITGHTCGDCGVEDRLFERGRCARCALRRRVTTLLAGPDGVVPAVLEPVAAALAAARQPYTALNWLRTGAGAGILADVAAGRLPLTHAGLDTHPQTGAAAFLRRLLIAHHVLPDRDEDVHRVEQWATGLLNDVDRPADQQLLRTYATWRVLRRLRRRAARNGGPRTPTATARNQLRAAVDLLAWLAAHDRPLDQATQRDIDAWLATGPGAHHVRDFLVWTAEHGHTPTLAVPAPGRRTGPAMDPDHRWATLARLLHDDTVDLTDRVAGALVLCYGQQLARITAMTRDQVTRHPDGTASIRFGADPVTVPPPLDGLLGDFLDTPRTYVGVGAPTTSRWLLPGHHPGRPLHPSHLGLRLRRVGIPTMAGRRATLLQLAAELPAAVLADLLNLSVGTAVGWVNNAGGDWSRYAATIAQEHGHTPLE